MNILIKNTRALLPEGDRLAVKFADIYISGTDIIAVNDIPDNFTADRTIDGSNFLTIPGLVNAHTHTYMSVFRNIADDLSFEDWLFGTINPLEDKLTPEDAYKGALLSCAEMIKTGTATFLDMHMFSGMTAAAADKLGMRAVISRGLVGSDRHDEGGIRRMDEALDEMQKWNNNPRLSFMLAPHAIYTCGTDYLSYIIEKAHEYDLPIHTHLSETVNEVNGCLSQHNMTPTEYLDSLGMFDIRTVAAHCVHLTDNDIRILKDKNVNVVHNPKSNLKLGNGIAPIHALEQAGVNICMGTDSQASNNSLNLFSDMNFAALLHKTGDPQAVGTQSVLKFASENGANALGINAGVIAPGKKADIAMLRLDVPEFYPRNDLLSALVYSANGTETDTVIIDGNIVLEHGHLTMADEEKIYADAQEVIERIR
ncbi:MAG: amidohydrolase [Oscillospiraceae bacterium]